MDELRYRDKMTDVDGIYIAVGVLYKQLVRLVRKKKSLKEKFAIRDAMFVLIDMAEKMEGDKK